MAENRHLIWVNCCELDSEVFLHDEERIAIDRMQEAIEPLDEQTVEIRGLITRFECCYHEADKEAMLIINAIGSGRCPPQSNERPEQRKAELQNSHDILSAWCRQAMDNVENLKVGSVTAEELVSRVGDRSDLRVWQVQRVVERIGNSLDPGKAYYSLALDGIGEDDRNGHYSDDADFFKRTRETIIRDEVNGEEAEISLAAAIDLLMPCHWDFIGCLCGILEVIGGQAAPTEPLTCCARNIGLSPLVGRLEAAAETLNSYRHDKEAQRTVDEGILSILGEKTAVKCWLAASFDKTIRYQLAGEFPLSLV